MQNFWDNLKTMALNAWSAFVGDVRTVAANVAPVLKQDIITVSQQLFPIAVNLIMGLAGAQFNQLSGGAKAAAVDAALLQHAKDNALSLIPADAAMIRQQAYNAVGMTAPPPATPADGSAANPSTAKA